MSSINELYQQLILEHNKSPRNFKKLDNPTKTVEGYNPLCGDHYTIFMKIGDGRVEDISFQGSGCAISKASASMMTSAVKGATVEEAEALFQKFRSVVTRKMDEEADVEELGSLGALAGVAEFPARIKCASLAWHAMHSALHEMNDSGKTIVTSETTE
ncbi:MAG: Fe-S cluster assembly sulfur transfer protein SufU [Acidobacteriota bacterium]